MAANSSESGNIMDEFENSFKACVHALTKQESNAGIEKSEVNLEVDQTILKFIDLARQMESFFLQKRLLLMGVKPEFLLREENTDLNIEIARKDELILRHYKKIEEWRSLLDGQKQLTESMGEMRPASGPLSSFGGNSVNLMGNNSLTGIPGNNMQMQAQHLQMQQQQQQQMLQQQQQQQQPPIQPQNQALNPQQIYNMQQQMHHMQPIRNSFGMGQNIHPGPLAYLEKTTSNIDLSGIDDGRR